MLCEFNDNFEPHSIEFNPESILTSIDNIEEIAGCICEDCRSLFGYRGDEIDCEECRKPIKDFFILGIDLSMDNEIPLCLECYRTHRIYHLKYYDVPYKDLDHYRTDLIYIFKYHAAPYKDMEFYIAHL